MKKGISIAMAAVVALSAVVSGSIGVGASTAPTATKYKTSSDLIKSGGEGSFDKVTLNNASNSPNPIVSYNATEFNKVLEIEDTANIPAVTFDYTVTLPDANIPATYSGTTVDTLAVFKGVNPEAISYKFENVVTDNTNGDHFEVNDNSAYVAITSTTSTGTSAFSIPYASQNLITATGTIDDTIIDATAAGGNSKKAVSDNVLINNVITADGTSSTIDTYYAIKTVQMDFSGCGFTEPGIYRYYITESGDNQGVTNDCTVTGTDNCKRTIDVYVEDATYTTGSGTTQTTTNDLKIAGYVMYQGHLKTGPKYKDPSSATATGDMNNFEDGLTNTSSTLDYGKINGGEVSGATKSEGIRNLYTTNDITFGKTVTGNQASKDKFFKFTIKLTDDTTSAASVKNVKDTDTFAIVGSWKKTVAASNPDDYNGIDGTPNAATPYAATVISKASNNSVDNSVTSVTDHGNNVVWLTGEQLKANTGYSFYLQDGDYITIKGLPNGIGYTLTEYQDDYTPVVNAFDGTVADNTTHAGRTVTGSFDGKNGSTDVSQTINISSNIQENPGNNAVITDTNVIADVDVQFTNTRQGTIPTGVILSVAAPAGIGVVVVGAIIYLVAKRRKDDDEDDE